MNASLDEIMLRFATFLSRNWVPVKEVAAALEDVEADEFMSDWAQANWELLVETAFRELAGFGGAFLEPYGEGADCNDASSRVWMPSATPTHQLVCRSRDGIGMHDLLTGKWIEPANAHVLFDHFAARSEHGWHEPAPPFDCVLGFMDNQEVLVSVDQLSFAAEEIGESVDRGARL
jgi:hypothetical protein